MAFYFLRTTPKQKLRGPCFLARGAGGHALFRYFLGGRLLKVNGLHINVDRRTAGR